MKTFSVPKRAKVEAVQGVGVLSLEAVSKSAEKPIDFRIFSFVRKNPDNLKVSLLGKIPAKKAVVFLAGDKVLIANENLFAELNWN